MEPTEQRLPIRLASFTFDPAEEKPDIRKELRVEEPPKDPT